MNLTQIAAIGEVWHHEDFWHVHFSTKLNPMHTDLYYTVKEISKINPTLPIRFTTQSSEVAWFWNDVNCNPFGPAHTIMEPGGRSSMSFSEFDSSKAMVSESYNHNGGYYDIQWDPNKRFELDKPSVVMTPFSNSKRINWVDAVETTGVPYRPGWELLSSAFHDGQRVRYYPYRQMIWIGGSIPNLERKDITKPTNIVDEHVFEHGVVLPDGKLELTRMAFSRNYEWAREYDANRQNQPIRMRNFHRGDGPAVVTVYNVKDTIRDKLYTTQVNGTYQREFWRNGRMMSGKEMLVWAKAHNVLVVDHPCHDRPAFPNEMDRALWVLSPD